MKQAFWSRALLGLGMLAMIVGALDPLEGSVIILPGVALAALGALVGHNQYRKLLAAAFVLVALGVGAMFALSAIGGFGGNSGHSNWWGLTILPYPVGWLMAIVCTGLAFRRPVQS
jgi:hypothetical protein